MKCSVCRKEMAKKAIDDNNYYFVCLSCGKEIGKNENVTVERKLDSELGTDKQSEFE